MIRALLADWRYPTDETRRDLRIDFCRGAVMFILVVNHIEIFSIHNLLVWERIGVVSGGEGFVILSGVVLGLVHRRRLETGSWSQSAGHLLARAFQLYRVSLLMIVSVALLSLLPFLNTEVIQTFVDQGSGTVYPLYPSWKAGLNHWMGSLVMLRIGPHQFQIMGLYVCLLMASPLALWMFLRKKSGTVLAISWILYLANAAFPVRPTAAQFEYGFPLLAWQLIFFHGLFFGFYWKQIADYFRGRKATAVYSVSFLLFLGFLFFTWNNPNPGLPSWYRLSFISSDTFHSLYQSYFTKNRLGILRLINYSVVMILGYRLLTLAWRPIRRALGWLLIPLGQASLYVFILHVYLIAIVTSIPALQGLKPSYGSGALWLTTLVHTAAVLLLWLLVKRRFLFRWIPR